MAHEGLVRMAERYPYNEGDVTVLGPEIFASKDGKVICWKGENYAPQELTYRLAEALRLTQEYIGDDLLPHIDGWDWYDALQEFAVHQSSHSD